MMQAARFATGCFLFRRIPLERNTKMRVYPKRVRIVFFFVLASAAPAGFAADPPDSTDSLPRMHWADTVSGAPLSKDPAVARFGDAYWLYYSIPPYKDKPNKGWTIGVAKSDNLVDWKKAGELDNAGAAEENGFTAPGAIVLGGKIHLFYQTYGNKSKDAICHAWSEDGLHFRRDPTNRSSVPPAIGIAAGRSTRTSSNTRESYCSIGQLAIRR